MKSELYFKITRSLTRGEREAALLELRENVALMVDAERMECEGNVLFYDGRKQDAIHKYTDAMNQFPGYNCARYQYMAGVKFELEGDFTEAAQRYLAAIDAEATFEDAYIELGGLYVKNGNLRIAAECFEAAIKISERPTIAIVNLLTVLRQLAVNDAQIMLRYRKAKKDYEKLMVHSDIPGDNYVW